MKKSRSHPRLLGVGLDKKDDHKRITRGEEFLLLGGSEEVHEKMSHTVIKTVESLKRKNLSLSEAHPAQVFDLIQEHTSK